MKYLIEKEAFANQIFNLIKYLIGNDAFAN